MMNQLRYKYYNKRITTCDNGNIQSHGQGSKMNSTVNANSGAHTLTHGKIIKSPFNKITVATIKRKHNSNNYNSDFITKACPVE